MFKWLKKNNDTENISIEENTNILKVNSPFMKNNSEPFIYTLGLMFEMTRVLKKYGY